MLLRLSDAFQASKIIAYENPARTPTGTSKNITLTVCKKALGLSVKKKYDKQKLKKEKTVDNGNERKIALLIITLRTFDQVFGSYSSVAFGKPTVCSLILNFNGLTGPQDSH